MGEFVHNLALGIVYGLTGTAVVGIAIWLIDAAIRGRK